MNKFLVAAVIASAIATFLAPQLAQARSCSGVTATARGVTQGIATTKAQWRLHRYVRNNLSGWGLRAGPRNSCQGWGVAQSLRPNCKSGAVYCS